MRLLHGITTVMAASLGIAIAVPAWAVPVLEFDSTSQSSIFTIDAPSGWEFITNEAITVDALDAFDPTGNREVRLYDGAGNVLASATLTTSDAQEGSPVLFYTHSITPVLLAANTNYFIAQDDGPKPVSRFDVTGLTTSPSITYVQAVAVAGLGHNPITNGTAGNNPGFFGPNFDIEVPEPASLALLMAWVGGPGVIRRKRAR